MDRLPALILASLTACTPDPPASPPPARFQAVEAAPKSVALDGWCDQRDLASPPAFVWPELDGPAPAIERPTWVNVWATWCVPCVAEMPRLVKWREQLAAEGVSADLVFLSVDAQARDVAGFYLKHAALPPSVRMRDVATLPAWLAAVGLDSSVAIPIHFFLGARGEVQCERAGAIGENDYAEVKAALGG